MYETLNFVIKDRVAYATFANPAKLNSITELRLEEMERVVAAVREDTALRGLVITGSGRAFCVGLNLDLLKRAFSDIGYFEATVRRLGRILLDLEVLPVPVIAAVNGIARAGGFEIALACDLMIIADEAQIGDNHTQVGVMPGGACMQRLRERIGEQRAKELIWNARWLSGQEAVACGLALKSVPRAQLEAATEVLLADMRHRPRECLGAIKLTMASVRNVDRATAFELEMRNFAHYMGSLPYGREGYEAWLEGRVPNWY